jgi:hypothetical protein
MAVPMDDNPYRSPRSQDADAADGSKRGASKLFASARPAFLLCGGSAIALYGITLLTTVLPWPTSVSEMIVGLVIGGAATFGGAFLAIYASRLR